MAIKEVGARRSDERRDGRLLAVVVVVTTATVLPAFLTGALAVQLRGDLGFAEAGLGLAVGAFFASAALGSALLGRAAERHGPERSLQCAAVLSAVVQVGVATLARSFASLTALLVIGGLANALAQPAANLFLARHYPPAHRGFAFGVKQAAIPTATLLGGLAVPVVALTLGWRWAFAGGAVLSLSSLLLVPRPPTPAVTPPAPRTESASGPRRAVRPPRPVGDAPLRSLVMLACGAALGGAAAGTLAAFLVSSGVEAGLSETMAGFSLVIGSAIGVTMRVLAGAYVDRRGGGGFPTVSAMLALGTAGYAILATGTPLAHVVALPMAFGAGWAWPGLFNFAIVRANPSSPAAATGITQTGTYLGAVAGPLIFGAVAARVSYGVAWTIAATFSVAAAAAVVAGGALLSARQEEGQVPQAGPPTGASLAQP